MMLIFEIIINYCNEIVFLISSKVINGLISIKLILKYKYEGYDTLRRYLISL